MYPGIDLDPDVEVDELGIVVTWREILDAISLLVENELISGAERLILEDFQYFVDERFGYLNPFNTFRRCKGRPYLLNRRCRNVLEMIAPGKVMYHRGWAHAVKLLSGAVREIGLYAELTEKQSWRIVLALYVGDTVAQAREFFANAKRDEFLALRAREWTVDSNLHFSFMATNLHWAKARLGAEEYFDFWAGNRKRIQQVRRDDSDWRSTIEWLRDRGLISDEDEHGLKRQFIDTNRRHMNVCPGFAVLFSWPEEKANSLDDSGEFVADVEARIAETVSTWQNSIAI